MKKLLSLICGWVGGALVGGIIVTASFWIYDTAAKEFSTFYLPDVLTQAILTSLTIGMLMTPGVMIAAVIRFIRPNFRDFRSGALACFVALITVGVFVGNTNHISKNDLPFLVFISITAAVVAALFWWITLKTDRVEQAADAKPDNVSS